eukprot:m51a1_g4511 hypothetical protein (279) ;mRNA; r:400106-400942
MAEWDLEGVPSLPVGRSEVYKRFARQYDALCSRQDSRSELRSRLAAALARLPPAALVLDLGCGTGKLSRAVAACAPAGVALRTLGLDRAAHMLSHAEHRFSASGPRPGAPGPTGLAAWALADHRRLPLRDGCADAVLACWTLSELKGEHWSSAQWQGVLDGALAEMRRVMRPGAVLLVAETLGHAEEGPARSGSHLHRWLAERGVGEPAAVRTDYEFESRASAEQATRFFFKAKYAGRMAVRDKGDGSGACVVVEHTAVWTCTREDIRIPPPGDGGTD